jgi:dUTPase
MMANHIGIIDSGYRNNLSCAFRYLPLDNRKKTYNIEAGTRLVQICHPSLLPIYVHLLTNKDDLTTTTRTGGFGSTGGTV